MEIRAPRSRPKPQSSCASHKQQTESIEPSAKAERTRAAILAAAEQEFARRGFNATRLEDVAAVVSLKRATLFYHFRDKQALYDAVVANAFGALTTRLTEVFSADDLPIIARMESAVGAWVDTVTSRPTLARLILRHAAEADEHGPHAIFPAAGHFVELAWGLFEEARARGECKPLHDDPFHTASAVIGATVFYVAALAPLAPSSSFKPALTPDQVAAHKQDVLLTLRLLLGISKKPQRRAASKPARKKKRAR